MGIVSCFVKRWKTDRLRNLTEEGQFQRSCPRRLLAAPLSMKMSPLAQGGTSEGLDSLTSTTLPYTPSARRGVKFHGSHGQILLVLLVVLGFSTADYEDEEDDDYDFLEEKACEKAEIFEDRTPYDGGLKIFLKHH